MSVNDDFRQALREFTGGGKNPAVLRWVEVRQVDRTARTMTAVGVADELEYYDIELGMGAATLFPVVGSVALVGIVEGQEAAAFLIAADRVERIELNAETEIVLNGGRQGGLVIAENVAEKLNNLERRLNELQQAVASWVIVPQDGGGALKTALAGWLSRSMAETQAAELENIKIKQ